MICPICLSPTCPQDGSKAPGCGADLSKVPAEIRDEAETRAHVIPQTREIAKLVLRDVIRAQKRLTSTVFLLDSCGVDAPPALAAVPAVKPPE